MKNKYEIDMCNGPIMSKLITFAIPLMLSSILQLLFNAVDIIVVGRFTGPKALAAVGSTTALINIFTNLFIGVSLGANVLTARYYASKNNEAVEDTVHTAITTALCSGLIMGLLGVLCSRFALQIMGTPQDVIAQSILYMRIYFCGMPFFMLYNYGAAILRAVGDTRRPLVYLVIAGFLNALMNLFLVIVCHLGVAGVAIATIFSQCISCILVMRCLCKTDGAYQLNFKKLHITKTTFFKILQIGLPAGIQSTVINISNAMLQSSVNSFGSISMAGYTAANNMLGFQYQAVNAISQACMSFTSQNYGARKTDRMDKVFRDCLILDCIIPVIFGYSVYHFGPTLLHIYTSDPEVIKAGMEVLAITCIPYFLCGIMDMFPGALRGMGHSTIPMILSVIGTVGTRIVWIYGFFPNHRSLFFLFISYPGSWLITILMQTVCFIFVRKKVRRELA